VGAKSRSGLISSRSSRARDPLLEISPTAGGSLTAGGAARAGHFSLQLVNKSGYDTGDLRKFFLKGLRAMNITGSRTVIIVAAPSRSRGCAEIPTGGPGTVSKKREAIVIAIAPPHRFTMKRLARLFEHEALHSKGYQHEDMAHDDMWSLGPTPPWAEGAKIRYLGRAPSQIP
jgi:hypothetical protein